MVRVTSLISKHGALVALTCIFFSGAPGMVQADECDPDNPIQMNDAICGPGLFTGKKGGWGYSGEVRRPSFDRDGAEESENGPATERAQQQALQQQSEALQRQSDLIDSKLEQLEAQQRQSELIDSKLEQLEAQQRELEELKEEVRDSLKNKSE